MLFPDLHKAALNRIIYVRSELIFRRPTKVSYKEGVLYTENGNFKVGKIDLLLGGSPCQDFSLLKIDGRGLEGNKSKLFYEYLRILKEVSPEYFLLENVKMKNESKKQLDEYLGVEGKYQWINNNKFSYHDGHLFMITPGDSHSFVNT